MRDTALLLGARRGHLDIVKMLLAEEGAELNLQNKDGDTALIVAVRRRDADDLIGRHVLDDRNRDVAEAADQRWRVQKVVAGDRHYRAAEQRAVRRCDHEHARLGAERELERTD